MNIVKLQENLKDVPFKNLIFYVQNPNGQVPSYLALAEIKRRKDMESRAAATQNAPSHLSVAEEMTAPRQNIGPQFDTPQTMMAAQRQAQPQTDAEAGVASLPTGDMYQDQSFAGGGIVAFAEGGKTDKVTDASNLENLPTLNVNTGESRYPVDPAAAANSTGLGSLFARMLGLGGMPIRMSPSALGLNYIGMGSNFPRILGGQRMAEGGEVKHFANEGAVVFDRNMGPATFDAELDDPSIDAYTRDLILRNRSMFGSDAPIQVAGEVNPALSSSQLGQSYWQNLKRKFALQKQKEARDIAIENERQLKFYGGAGGYKSKESPVMTDKEIATKARADQATKDVTEPTITQDMINKLNAGAPAGGGIGGLRPNIAASKEKSIDEMIDDRRKLLESQGIKTDYYSKMVEDLRKEKGEELDASKRMMQANILFSLAKSVGETPGGIMRGLTKGATEVGPAVMQGLKDQREIEKLGKKEERAMAALERAEKRGDTDAIEKARDKYQQIQAELEGRKISGEYSLAAARISSKPTTFEQVMSGLRGNKAYYKMVDGKPVFDTEKAYNTYLGTRSGGALSETTLLKEYNDLVTQGRIDPALVSFQSYKASVGSNAGAATAGWGDLQVSK